MILYHFTCVEHMPKIYAARYLKTTESNMSMRRPHAGPDVVWLTSNPARDAEGTGLVSSSVDKTAVRITVEVPDEEAYEWISWSRKRYITKAWATALEKGKNPEHWYVVERTIPQEEWLTVEVSAEYHGAGNE